MTLTDQFRFSIHIQEVAGNNHQKGQKQAYPDVGLAKDGPNPYD
jgi:hypothetical protein